MPKIKINSDLWSYAVSTGTKLNFSLLASTDTSARSSPFFNDIIEEAKRYGDYQQFLKTISIMDKFEKRSPYVIYVTFGQQYAREKHHLIPEVHPAGWIEFHCNSAKEVNMLKQRFLGNAYSYMQQADKFKPAFYPRGCLRVITIKDLLAPISLTESLD